MLLCPAPVTTMSKRSYLGVCWQMENGVPASGASAAVFTNPRLLILLMRAPPRNDLLHFLLHNFFDAGPKIFQHYSRRVSAWPSGDRSAWMRRRAGLIQARNRHAMLRPARHGTHRASLCRPGAAGV